MRERDEGKKQKGKEMEDMEVRKKKPGKEQWFQNERTGEKILEHFTLDDQTCSSHGRQLRWFNSASHSMRRKTNMLRQDTHTEQEHTNNAPSQNPNTAGKQFS